MKEGFRYLSSNQITILLFSSLTSLPGRRKYNTLSGLVISDIIFFSSWAISSLNLWYSATSAYKQKQKKRQYATQIKKQIQKLRLEEHINYQRTKITSPEASSMAASCSSFVTFLPISGKA